jgi:hypothetical protein
MNKSEVERLLLDPEGLKRLADAGSTIRESVGFERADSEPRTAVRSVGRSPYAVRATAEETAATDRRNINRKSILANIGTVLSELAGKAPQAALAHLTEKYREDPSETTEFLVQDAINRLTHVGELDAESVELVHQAIETLTSVKLPSQQDAKYKDSIWSRLYQHSDFKGRSYLAYLGPSSVYSALRKQALQNVDLHDRISSLTLDASAGEERGDCILFEHDRFFGRFASIRTNVNDPTQAVPVTYVGDTMNDRTSSVLLVRRFSNESMMALGNPITKALIGNIIGDVKKIEKLRGDPVFTWDMWPTGGDEHPNDPDKRFIQIKIPVEIDVNNWFNYDAEIWLWFYLYIGDTALYFGDGGALKGYLAHYGAWVESGLISGSVLDGIMDALPGKFGEIDALLDTQLSAVNGNAPFTDVHLLPGDQTLFDTQPYMEGHVEDNVTVVLLKSPSPVFTTSSVAVL